MNERLWGILADSFPKILKYGIEVTQHCTPGDERAAITKAVCDFHAAGVFDRSTANRTRISLLQVLDIRFLKVNDLLKIQFPAFTGGV